MEKGNDNKRIQEFIDTVMMVARGNLNCQIELSEENDDLDSLAMGINMMIDDLKNNSLIKAQNKKIKKINKELKKAKEKAERSDRLKSAFLANISHEIRTPMNGILGFTELLKDKKIPKDEKEQFIEIIEDNGSKLLGIINDLIDLSKIESGNIEVYKTPVNINEQLTKLYDFFVPIGTKKGLKIRLHKPLKDEDTWVTTDDEKLYAILVNLINNACKYTFKGTVDIGYIKHNTHYEISVKDTGIGIRKNMHKAIFERFIQAENSMTRNFEGTGLGLPITKAYVEMLGGKIELESEFGKGSVFSFTLPL